MEGEWRVDSDGGTGSLLLHRTTAEPATPPRGPPRMLRGVMLTALLQQEEALLLDVARALCG